MADEASTGIDLGVAPGTIRTVRLGGIALIGSLALPGAGLVVARTLETVLALAALNLALFAFGLWASRMCFAARGYRPATLPVLIAIAALILAAAFVYWGVLVQGTQLMTLARIPGPWFWPVMLPTIVAQIALIVFAARAIQFGRDGGAIWTAIGVLHILSAGSIITLCLVAMGVTVLAAKPGGFSVLALGGVTAVVVVLVYPATLICHAIGLFKGARQLEAMREVATAFD